jgi:membrane associated rhomboid family serine protease
MFKRQTSGSVVCASCGYLVGVRDERCYHCGRRNPGLWGFAPALRSLGQDLGFVPFVTGICVVVYVVSLLLSGGNIGVAGMGFLSPDACAIVQLGASGGFPVFTLHRWWTVLAASWLHGSLLHILFNMYGVRQLGPGVAELYGPGRMVIVYTAGGIVGFLFSSTMGLVLYPPEHFHMTLGASASIFGLLGAAVYYGRRSGSRFVQSQAMYYAISMFVFGLLFPGIDNYAHAGGFAGGWLAGRLLDPLRPERINHMLGAVVCLVLSLLSIVVSYLVSTAPFC